MSEPPQVLIVDDEPAICANCVKILSKAGYAAASASNGVEALALMARNSVDVVVTDLKMSRMGGMELLRRIREAYPETMVVVITGYSTVSSAVEVMKIGAFDYLPKPFTPDELREIVRQALAAGQVVKQNRHLASPAAGPRKTTHQLVGGSPKIAKVVEMIAKVAPTDATVMIYGESGTGKELVARAVHANSRRADKVFFAVDCGTLSGELLASELFGHVKGAFTNAHRDKAGIFQQADGGTVFLDEIGNIDLEVQSKLLRFLESQEFLPIGGTVLQKVNIRLIFASNQQLEELVAANRFRPDFYYRIFVYPILLPPLRDRREDILPIAYHFIRQFCRRMQKTVKGLSHPAAQRLIHHDWPGNVRQLRNVVERAMIQCETDEISLTDLSLDSPGADLSHLIDQVPQTNAEFKQLKKVIRDKAVDLVEKNFITQALIRSQWNVTRAARSVGLQRSNFQKLMQKHGIKRPAGPIPE